MGLEAAVREAKNQLTGSGAGEKPSLVQVSSAEIISNQGRELVRLRLNSQYSPSPTNAGRVLARLDPQTYNECNVLYTVSANTEGANEIICYTGYEGSPKLADADAYANTWWDQNAPYSSMSHTIWQKAEYVLENQLWPQIWEWTTYTVNAPNSYGWENVPASAGNLREVVQPGWQLHSHETEPVAVGLDRNVGTSPSGIVMRYDPNITYLGTPLYVTCKRQYGETDVGVAAGLAHLVGTGAAALTLDSAVATERLVSIDPTQPPRDLSRLKWRDFLQQREQWSKQLRSDVPKGMIYVG